jgi:hypothetical protein
MTALVLPARPGSRHWSASRALARAARGWLARHAASFVVLAPVLGIVAFAHRAGSADFPSYVDDSGLYLSHAWSLLYEGRLSPYTYLYDHPPAGWMQIALWAALTNGFQRYHSALDFGAEFMLLAKVTATALGYALGRRLGFGRPAAALATILFGLCPLALVFGRWVFLDNLMIVWLLAAFVLAYAPSRSIGAATGATASFAIAVLTKETALVLLPAFLWALLRNLDARNRQQVLTVSLYSGTLLLALYPLLALYKGELFPRAGHTSLLGTAWWHLAGRESSGWLFDSGSAVRGLLGHWLSEDPYLLLAGLLALPVVAFVPRLRPIALALALGWLMLLRGGYVPFMYVVVLLPFSALAVAGAVEAFSGNRRVVDAGRLRVRTKRIGRLVRGWYALLLGVILLVLAGMAWVGPLRRITGEHQPQPLRQAAQWMGTNVPPDRIVVVHDAIWTDLKHYYGFSPVLVSKVDNDPAVRRALPRIDYLVVPERLYDGDGYPTIVRARDHAVREASFGQGPDAVNIYRVSAMWTP